MPNETRYLTKRHQAERYNVSTKTIERWAADPALNYPPAIDVNGREYREEGALDDWDRSRAAIAANKAATRKSRVAA